MPSKNASQETDNNAVVQAINISFATVEFDAQGNIQDVNSNFVSTLGYDSQEELIGKHHNTLCEEAFTKSKAYKKFWKDLANGHAQAGEFKRLRKDGRDIYLQAAYTPIKENGQVIRVIKIAQDVTKATLNRLAIQKTKNASDASFAPLKFDIKGTIKEDQESLKNVVENLDKRSEPTEGTTKPIEVLNQRSEELAKTLGAITNIAGQTNLLALNKAIEAAKAGKAGRKFASIAEAIQKLAEGSKKYSGDIIGLLEGIQHDTHAAEDAIKSVKKIAPNGKAVSNKAAKPFGTTPASTKQTLSQSGVIEKLTTKQKEDIQAAVKNIEQIVAVAEQTASSSKQEESTAHQLPEPMEEFSDSRQYLNSVSQGLEKGFSSFSEDHSIIADITKSMQNEKRKFNEPMEVHKGTIGKDFERKPIAQRASVELSKNSRETNDIITQIKDIGEVIQGRKTNGKVSDTTNDNESDG